MSETALKLLLERRSVVANKLGPPGPDDGQLRRILRAAARVPDHKRLVPWRFILFQGEARAAFGEVLAAACRSADSSSGTSTEIFRFRLLSSSTFSCMEPLSAGFSPQSPLPRLAYRNLLMFHFGEFPARWECIHDTELFQKNHARRTA